MLMTGQPPVAGDGRARVVLDTNACLDLFVFADPRAARLMAALAGGEACAVTNDECRAEWLRVLGYRQLQLDEPARVAAAAAFDACVECLVEAVTAADVSGGETPHGDNVHVKTRAPRCRDPDDQKFLELALRCGARWLVSRDAQVLRLGSRTRRDGLFEIVSPQAWAPAEVPSATAG